MKHAVHSQIDQYSSALIKCSRKSVRSDVSAGHTMHCTEELAKALEKFNVKQF